MPKAEINLSYLLQDEYSDGPSPIPSWIRAKKLIAENWHIMEQLGGNRKDTLEALNEYAAIVSLQISLLQSFGVCRNATHFTLRYSQAQAL